MGCHVLGKRAGGGRAGMDGEHGRASAAVPAWDQSDCADRKNEIRGAEWEETRNCWHWARVLLRTG